MHCASIRFFSPFSPRNFSPRTANPTATPVALLRRRGSSIAMLHHHVARLPSPHLTPHWTTPLNPSQPLSILSHSILSPSRSLGLWVGGLFSTELSEGGKGRPRGIRPRTDGNCGHQGREKQRGGPCVDREKGDVSAWTRRHVRA